MNCDTDMRSSELFTTKELKGGKFSGANLSNEEEECRKVISSSFKDELH